MSFHLPTTFLESLPLPESEKNDFIDALHSAPLVSIRINEEKAGLTIAAEAIPWVANGYYLSKRPRFTSDPAFHAGAYYPQEASSMFLSFIIKALGLDKSAIRALDLCAAPGGKSTILRTDLHPSAYLVANEVLKSRANLLEETLIKWGQTGFSTTSAEAAEFGSLTHFFDLILVDAPCSGEGLFRKQESAVEQWSPNAVEMCATRQKQILSDIWPALAPGGILIYSTCTYNRKENEENLDWLAKEFEAEPVAIDIPENLGIEEVRTGENMSGYRFMPHRTKGEGFFVALVRKPEGKRKKEKAAPTVYQRDEFPDMNGENRLIIKNSNQECFAIQPNHFKDVNYLAKAIYNITPGIPVGMRYGKKFKPNHGLSQMVGATGLPKTIDLTLQEAIHYLEKNEVPCSLPNQQLVLIVFEGFRLGFAKAHQKRFISRYPSPWRIRHGISEKYSKIVNAKEY